MIYKYSFTFINVHSNSILFLFTNLKFTLLDLYFHKIDCNNNKLHL